jgi:hypothetical protein
MKLSIMHNNSNKPDHEFDAYLKRQDSTDILCDVRIWLPRDASEDMHVSVFAPDTQDVNSVFSLDPMTLKSEIYQTPPIFNVIASGVHIKHVHAPIEMRKASGTTIELLHIAEIKIDSKISSAQAPSESTSDETIKNLSFYLSDLKFATPVASIIPNYLGSRQVDIKKIYVVKCSDNYGCSGEFRFEKHYSSWRKHGPNKEIVSSQRVLVWQGNDSTKAIDIPNLLKLADDVCLLLSLAAKHRVMVLDYHYSTPHRRFQHYRSPLKRNRIEREETGHDALIPLVEFEVFMQTALTAWEKLSDEDRDRLRLAIVSLHPLTDFSSQRNYLAMFAALEGLVGLYRENIVSELEHTWKDVESSISECIDSQPSLNLEAKEFLKKNLFALKQGKKLKDRMKGFFRSLNVYVDDLWPIFGEGKLPDLYWIRNALAHGRHFNDERFGVFLIAEEHMCLTLERVVLSILGFDPHKTTAGLQSLHNQGLRLTSNQLKELQKQISKMP